MELRWMLKDLSNMLKPRREVSEEEVEVEVVSSKRELGKTRTHP